MTKLILIILGLAVSFATGFVPSQPAFVSRSIALKVETGANGKPAKSKEEDLELTRQIIFQHLGDDEAGKEADPAPVAEPAPVATAVEE